MKRTRFAAFVLFCAALCMPTAAQDIKSSATTKPAIVQDGVVELGDKIQLSQAAVRNQERISRAWKKKRAVTIKLKQSAVYFFVPKNSSEVKHVAGEREKIAGRIEQVGEEEFWIGERDLIGWQYLTLRVRYEDIEDVHFNLIPNGVKSTGEFLYYCVLLLPFGICDP